MTSALMPQLELHDGPLFSASLDAVVPDAVASDGRFEKNWSDEWTELPEAHAIEIEYIRTPRLWVSPESYLRGWLPLGWIGQLAGESADGSMRAVFFQARVVGVSPRGVELDLEIPEDREHPFSVWVTDPPPTPQRSA